MLNPSLPSPTWRYIVGSNLTDASGVVSGQPSPRHGPACTSVTTGGVFCFGGNQYNSGKFILGQTETKNQITNFLFYTKYLLRISGSLIQVQVQCGVKSNRMHPRLAVPLLVITMALLPT